jgi:hypothetical protein
MEYNAEIIEVVGMDNRGKYGLVHVVLDNGEEAVCIVGGEVKVSMKNGQIRAHVKHKKDKLDSEGSNDL